jgi:hypothetical protein
MGLAGVAEIVAGSPQSVGVTISSPQLIVIGNKRVQNNLKTVLFLINFLPSF